MHLRRSRAAFPPPPTIEGAPSIEEARREQKASSSRFIEAAHNGTEVRRVSSEMRRLRIRNGYEELIEIAMQPRRGDAR